MENDNRWNEYVVELGEGLALLMGPDLPADELYFKCSQMNYNNLSYLATSSNSPEILIQIYKILVERKKESNGIKTELAQNIFTPVHILEELAQNKNEYIVGCVANNKMTPEYLLSSLTSHSEAHVRRIVAAHPSLPLTALYQLLEDLDASVANAAMVALTTRKDSPMSDLPENWVKRSIKKDSKRF